ncbi:Uncharacterised protein [Amycolatopsis camponoti]|uniref:Uncharacterized protein n=1 Tax=Amycolatopsis camponoti TaxID=2606593 RepID=A0A6I8LWN7_9PSEU|nr:Uncharacterised protein [Amycolatopsis camponoti]
MCWAAAGPDHGKGGVSAFGDELRLPVLAKDEIREALATAVR